MDEQTVSQSSEEKAAAAETEEAGAGDPEAKSPPIALCGKAFGMEGTSPKLCTKPKGHQNSADHGEKVCGYAEAS